MNGAMQRGWLKWQNLWLGKYRCFIYILKNMPNRTNLGFTLIELLVVIAIIGLLASMILVALNNGRQRARDARRLSDLYQVRTALEMYYNGPGQETYPIEACYDGWAGNCEACGYSYISCWNDLAAKLSPFLKLPDDPLNAGTFSGYWYQTKKGGQGYIFEMYPELLGGNKDDGCDPESPEWYCIGNNWQ